MRLRAGVGLAVPAVLLALLVAAPAIGGAGPSQLSLVALGALIMYLAGTSAALYLGVRFEPLIQAAERMAAGEQEVPVPARRRSLPGRLSRALDGISSTMSTSQEAATVDRLTGVSNRAALLGALFTEVERATRYNRPLSVAFVDIDHFKVVNDTYGHGAGDLVLRGIAQAIKANLRATDVIGRYGGEEFMLLLTETNVEDGAMLTEKVRSLVSRQAFSVDGNPQLSVTISIGIAGGTGQHLRVDALIRDADAAMYSAKALGRNQTYIFAEPDDDARVPRAPISAAGRARAIEVGQRAREAAAAALTQVIAPLPHYRGQPSALIATIVTELARQMDLPDAEIDRIRIAALLHDVGKVAIPQEILEKPASLTSAEWRSVVQHPRIGQVILEQATALKEAVPIILHHHERYSGHGYPYGLRGNDIPLGARIVAIADAYDAMTHDRPYKQSMSHENAIRELRRHAGTQFDPELVALFCDTYTHVAPEPDPTILAITAPMAVHSGAPLVVPTSAGTTRPRRRGAGSPRALQADSSRAPADEIATG